MPQHRRTPRTAIEIIANPQREGCSYELHPLSRRALHERYPDVTIAPSIFIGYESREDFESLHGAMWDQIIRLLTGLSEHDLAPLGGVYIVMPTTDRILHDTRPDDDVEARVHA